MPRGGSSVGSGGVREATSAARSAGISGGGNAGSGRAAASSSRGGGKGGGPSRSAGGRKGRRHRDARGGAGGGGAAAGGGEGGPAAPTSSSRRRRRGGGGSKARTQPALQYLVQFQHVVDVGLGLTLLIYGGRVGGQSSSPGGAVALLVTFGVLLLVPALLGAVGFFSPAYNRIGLSVSSYAAPLIAAMEIVGAIAVVAAKDAFVDFLTDNKDALLLSDASVDRIETAVPALFVAGFLLAFVEICRFFVVARMRKDLLRHDKTKQQEGRRGTAATDPLRDPLLEVEEPERSGTAAATAVPPSRRGRPKGAVAPDPSTSSAGKSQRGDARSHASSAAASGGGGGWFANLAGWFTSARRGDDLEGDSSDEFAPVDEDLHVLSLMWSQANAGDDDEDASSVYSGSAYDMSWVDRGLSQEANPPPPPPKFDL